MSESDSDGYGGDILKNRRKTLAKQKRKQQQQQQLATFTDSDDDEDDSPQLPKKPCVLSDDDDDISFIEGPSMPKTHQEYLQEKKQKEMRNYDRKIEATVAAEMSKSRGRAVKTVGLIDRAYEALNVNTDDDDDEVLQIPDKSANDSDINTSIQFTNVEIEVFDMESGKGRFDRYNIELNDNFNIINKELAERWNSPLDHVQLRCKGRIIDSNSTPETLGFTPLMVPPPRFDAFKVQAPVITIGDGLPTASKEKENEEKEESVIKFQIAGHRRPITVPFENNYTIGKLKSLLMDELEKINDDILPDVNEIKLIFDDQYLTQDELTCEGLGIEDGDCIDVY
ncbi:unnamed protein product [Caenorhabditis bovis]|uniref:Ubiquitin-like domain-containing protein n=1 Tax=Caenorhabditis bovis TaxID=2654633 RepID=A0A8S1EPT9_9PELO|nr:unnamed protein product [Caenorhabditis bovis]